MRLALGSDRRTVVLRVLVLPAVLAAVTAVVAACSGGGASVASVDVPAAPDAALADGGGMAEASVDGGSDGASPPGAAIEGLPADTWAWVDFPASRCVRGSATGIGVNVHPGSDRVVIYLEGGGSCGKDCWKDEGIVTTYGAAEFALEDKVHGRPPTYPRPMLTLDRAASDNPFKDANLVFVPYCTGDVHAGTRTWNDGVHDFDFWGQKDLDMFLARLVPTFPGATRVWLTGSSAGGGGALLNYARVRSAFGARTDLIVDSAPPIASVGKAAQADLRDQELWGVPMPLGCTTCTDLPSIDAFNRSLDPSARFAYLSYRYDDVIARGKGLALAPFGEALGAFVQGLPTTPESRGFVVVNALAAPEHVVDNVTIPSGVRAALAPWLGAMVNGASWTSTTTPDE